MIDAMHRIPRLPWQWVLAWLALAGGASRAEAQTPPGNRPPLVRGVIPVAPGAAPATSAPTVQRDPLVTPTAATVRAPILRPAQAASSAGSPIPRVATPLRTANQAATAPQVEMLPAPPAVSVPVMPAQPPTVSAPVLAPAPSYQVPSNAVPGPNYPPPGASFTSGIPPVSPVPFNPGLPPAAPPPNPGAPQGYFASLAEVRALALSNNKDLAVLEFTPQMLQTEIQAAEGVFRPVVGVRAGGVKQFNQVATQIQSFGSNSDTLAQDSFTPLDGPNQVYSQQLFRTGTRIESGFGTNYLNVDPIGTLVLFNPYWNTTANTAIEQPLFRGRGPVATMAPIRIATANHCQSVHQLQASINQLLRDVEIAYWAEYAGQREVAMREQILRISTETWQRESELLRIGQGTVPDVAQAEEQMETYRLALIDAENRLALAQRDLRRIAGLHPGDPRVLCSGEMPPAVVDEVNFNHALSSAMQRPELLAQQQAIEAANIEVARTRNLTSPDLAVRLGHSSTGLDDRLDQSVGHMWGRFNTWSAGLVFRRSLGQPIEQAAYRRAMLAMSRQQAELANVEQRIQFELDAAYRNLSDGRRMLEVQARRREAAARQLEARRALYLEGRASLLSQLDAESRYSTSVIEEITAMRAYQRALADWNYAQGAYAKESVTFADSAPAPSSGALEAIYDPRQQPTIAPPQHSPTR
ncbi:MAG: TolC family protein [Planctomycetaceae bacterium]|nr:TolC family protein [Planctomycetaceae bacterium]